MAENPLLPNARLRLLHQTMQQAVKLAAKNLAAKKPAPKMPSTKPRALPLEAVLAGSLLHLEDGDFVLPLPGATSLGLLAAMDFNAERPQPERNASLLGAGAALALGEGDGDRCALVFVQAGHASRTDPGWADALRYATSARLPMVVVCVDGEAPAAAGRTGDMTWTTVQALAKSMQRAALYLPVIPIDGEDAVAVYRATQESMLRARQGGGPAVLWCVLGEGGGRTPVQRLRQYLKARGLEALAK